MREKEKILKEMREEIKKIIPVCENLMHVRFPIKFTLVKGCFVRGRCYPNVIRMAIGRMAKVEDIVYIIIHELAHAKQRREGVAFGNSRLRHDDRPWEAEANFWARKYTPIALQSVSSVFQKLQAELTELIFSKMEGEWTTKS